MDLKHYSTMPESIDETSIKPESYVVIDDIRVMGLKHGSQRECRYKFFTMYSHHHKLNVFFLSQSFDNIKDMKINANFLYLFWFTDKANHGQQCHDTHTLALLHFLTGQPVVALSLFPMSLYVSEFQPSAAALSTSIASLLMTKY